MAGMAKKLWHMAAGIEKYVAAVISKASRKKTCMWRSNGIGVAAWHIWRNNNQYNISGESEIEKAKK